MARSTLTIGMMVIVAVAAVFSAAVSAYTNSYVEDFTKTQYCDTLNTTAWWGTTAGGAAAPAVCAGACRYARDARLCDGYRRRRRL